MSEPNPGQHLPRLAEESAELMSLLAEAEAEYRNGIDESGAWQRLERKLDATPRRRPWFAISAAALAAASMALVVGWAAGSHWGRPDSRPIASSIPAAPSSTPPSGLPTVLPVGPTVLPDGTRAVVEDGSVVRYRPSDRGIALQVGRGHLELTVTRQAADHPFTVRSPTHELRVLGTRFAVTVTEDRTELSVSEGRVGVYARDELLTVVGAGEHWSSQGDPGAPSARAPERPPQAAASTRIVPDQAGCQRLVRLGQSRDAEQCYLDIARSGRGLAGEMAWYELARLRRDVLGNPAGALGALDEYERRYPGGSLSPEVEMSRVDLLARLGRVNEALDASERLLTTATGRARQCELRMVRGNLMRDRLKDCARAEAEYRRCESDPAGWGDRAALARAECLERLGRTREAIAAYQAYLGRPHPLGADQARRRLEALSP